MECPDPHSLMRLDTSDVGLLQDTISGEVCLPGSSGFDETVNIWNGNITKRPSVAVRVRSPRDVAAALRFAQDRGLEVSVRGGGHSYGGSALTDGGLTVDLSLLRNVT